MYKVILVDDEPIILKGLRKLIQWEELGCEIVETASNGDEALELIEMIRPDILITDLVMPTMDGMTMIRKVNELRLNTKVVILSGHGEFEYAQEAIKNDVCEFLLKPVKPQALSDAVRKVIQEIDGERQHYQNLDRLQSQVRESLPALRDRFLFSLLKGTVEDSTAIDRNLAFLGIDLQGVSYSVVIVELENNQSSKLVTLQSDSYLIRSAACNVIEEILRRNHSGFVVSEKNRVYAAVAGDSCCLDVKELFLLCEAMADSLMLYLDITATIGMGRSYTRLDRLHLSFEEATTALRHKFFKGRGTVISINEVMQYDRFDSGSINLSEKKMLEDIQYGAAANHTAMAEELIAYYKGVFKADTGSIFFSCYNFLVQLKRLLLSQGVGINAELEGFIGNPQQHAEQMTMIELTHLIDRQIGMAISGIMANRNEKFTDIVEDAKRFVEEHYMQDVSLTAIASRFFVSPTYFCKLFKSKTGTNFHDFLTMVRMEKAARLLSAGHETVYAVSTAVGYSNPRYFSEAFKKYFGVIPTEYSRAKAMQEKGAE